MRAEGEAAGRELALAAARPSTSRGHRGAPGRAAAGPRRAARRTRVSSRSAMTLVGLPPANVEPHAQRALARSRPAAAAAATRATRDIGVVEADVEAPLALRASPCGSTRGDLAAQVERRRELGGRRADEAEAMLAEALLEPERHVVEHELRRAAQLVVPDDQRVAHDDLALAQQPVGERGCRRRASPGRSRCRRRADGPAASRRTASCGPLDR